MLCLATSIRVMRRANGGASELRWLPRGLVGRWLVNRFLYRLLYDESSLCETTLAEERNARKK